MQLACRKAVCPRGGHETQERVVVHGHVPEVGVCRALDRFERPEEPARQVDEVNSLIDKLATTGSERIRPPLALVTRPPAVAVASPHEHQLADCAPRRPAGVPVVAPDDTDG